MSALDWYRVSFEDGKVTRIERQGQSCTHVPEGFMRQYESGAREYYVQAFDVEDALERWKRAGS